MLVSPASAKRKIQNNTAFMYKHRNVPNSSILFSSATTMHDRPPNKFRSVPVEEQHDLFKKLMSQYEVFKPRYIDSKTGENTKMGRFSGSLLMTFVVSAALRPKRMKLPSQRKMSAEKLSRKGTDLSCWSAVQVGQKMKTSQFYSQPCKVRGTINKSCQILR